jgi:hypothetical protein
MTWRNRRRRGRWPGPRSSTPASQPASQSQARQPPRRICHYLRERGGVPRQRNAGPVRQQQDRPCLRPGGGEARPGDRGTHADTYHAGGRSRRPVSRSWAASQRRHHRGHRRFRGQPHKGRGAGGSRKRRANARHSRGPGELAALARRLWRGAAAPGRRPPPPCSQSRGWGVWICTPFGILSEWHWRNYSEFTLLRSRNAMFFYRLNDGTAASRPGHDQLRLPGPV